jgi:hypothetical protein
MSTDIKITTELLYKGALIFALMDAIYVPLLARGANKETFRKLKWTLVIATVFVWYGIWSWAIGSLTHIWAVHRGIVTKPPMLQGASPLAAVVMAFFEFMFYWCTILVLAKMIDWTRTRLQNRLITMKSKHL